MSAFHNSFSGKVLNFTDEKYDNVINIINSVDLNNSLDKNDVYGSVLNIPFEDESIDCIIFDKKKYTENQLVYVYAECRRVLKEGGVLIDYKSTNSFLIKSKEQ